jgi:acyl carrier protein
VREAVVVAREDETGDKSLVAYCVVPNGGQEPQMSELRVFMKSKMPEYMVPSAFMLLEALPLTPNGKVDRKALPPPEGGQHPNLEDTFVAPRDELEERLAGICSEVLGIPLVGIHDNFFELGGHSLLATQVTSRLRDALQVELPLRDLFEAPTVALLAQRVERARSADQRTTSSPVSNMRSRKLDEGRL